MNKFAHLALAPSASETVERFVMRRERALERPEIGRNLTCLTLLPNVTTSTGGLYNELGFRQTLATAPRHTNSLSRAQFDIFNLCNGPRETKKVRTMLSRTARALLRNKMYVLLSCGMNTLFSLSKILS